LKSSTSKTISASLRLYRCARAFAGERLVEVAPVVETRERVEVGELASFPELLGVADRRRGAVRELLELADVVLAEAPALVARVDGEVADPAAGLLERHREPAPHEPLRRGLLGVVEIGHLDRPRPRAVGRARDRVGAVRREPAGRHGRPALLAVEPDERGVEALEPRSRLERPGEHLVHVDRACDLPEEAASPALVLGPLDRCRELVRELVHPLLERLHDRVDSLVRPGPGPPGDDREQEREDDDAARKGRHDERKCVIHRRESSEYGPRTCSKLWAERPDLAQPNGLTAHSGFRYHAAGRLAGPRRPANRLFVEIRMLEEKS
jgi:hypothetical protein